MRVSLRVTTPTTGAAMLTDTRIRNARKEKQPRKLTDSGGLYVEIRPTGAKLWRYRYRITGKENLYALGEYAQAPSVETRKEAEARRAGGLFTLTEARAERERCRGLVKQGIHPAQQRRLEAIKRQHEGANTFAAVAREWISSNAAHWRARTRTQRERLLEREVFPHIGSLPIRQVTPAHVLAILKRLEKEAPSFAVLAQQAIGATFRLAVSTLRAEADPVAPLRGSVKTPPTQHKTPLEAKEIPGFFRALADYTGSFQTKAALRLVWLTLTRTNETLRAKWSEFDLDEAKWEIPGERMKKRTIRPHVIPLPTQAVDQLRRLHVITGDSEYLFPNRSSNKRPAAVTLLNKAVSSMGYAGKFSPHAIRTTGSTALNEMGFNGDWIERQLAHHDRNETRASYNGAKYLEQRSEMMQSWADYLDALCAGRKVVSIKTRKAA
jgi:integrase